MIKNLVGILFLLNLALINSASANTEYLVARGGAMFINAQSTKPLVASGVYYGYSLDENVSLEAEANVGIAGGAYNDGTGNYGNFNIWTIAAYAAYRHPFTSTFYGKGKFGLLFENITNHTRSEKLVRQDYGFSGGMGLGFHVQQKLTLELEFTLLEQDIYYSGLGVHYKFQ